GWERHTSRSDGALFLHNPDTGESVWFTGWVEKTSKWYGRNYWFQPTTGRSEWDLPSDSSAPWKESTQQQHHLPVEPAPAPSTDKINTWKEKIAAAKAKAAAAAAAAAEGGAATASTPPGGDAGGNAGGSADGDGGAVRGATRKRSRGESGDGSSSDDMEVDEDVAREVELTEPPEVPPPPPEPARLLEDVPSVSLRRETLRKGCLERFANENSTHGPMLGYSKTSKSCRDEGMAKGLSGMFGRFLWVQHMRQTMGIGSGDVHRASKLPPDPVFPSVEDTDDKLIAELVDGGRSVAQAGRVLEELGRACREAAAELEALIQVELPGLPGQEVILQQEVPTAKGQMRMRQVTGKGARVPGPNPNASYKLRYTPPEGSEERETSFAITGAHLEKTWKAYGQRVEGKQPVWNPDFV
ncbi:unnamed protein product, partial [Laminaria digitata]